MRQMHNTQDNLTVTLEGAVNASVTSFVLEAGDGATCPSLPFWLSIDSEQVEVTARTTDTLTVVRAANSTSASAHADAVSLRLYNVAAKPQEHDALFAMLGRFLSRSWGGGDVVIEGALDAFEVVAQGTPDMTVQVGTGMGFVSNRPVELTTAVDTSAITAPVTNPRIDIVQISQYTDDVQTSGVTTKGGAEAGSPSAPSVDSGCLKLAEIYCRVGMTSIKDTDDASNGYITDSRVYG